MLDNFTLVNSLPSFFYPLINLIVKRADIIPVNRRSKFLRYAIDSSTKMCFINIAENNRVYNF